ncbi:MAG: ferritin [Lentimicrobiaceae bacterium]|nr:ferritin [Lentimicrobiaceae bacterium]
MINKTVEKAINEQIKLEEHSSRIYLAMASWCETNGLPGAAAYLFKQTEEERFHLRKFINYQNDRGGFAKLQTLDAPEFEFKSLNDLFEKVLVHEELITSSISNLYEIAVNEKDFTTANFLQWFITEQIEEESTFRTIIDKIKLAGTEKGGYFLMDKELAAMAAAKIVPSADTVN